MYYTYQSSREFTPEEIEEMKRQQAEFEKWQAMQPPTQEERIADLQQQNEFLTQCILEMSEIVYQ